MRVANLIRTRLHPSRIVHLPRDTSWKQLDASLHELVQHTHEYRLEYAIVYINAEIGDGIEMHASVYDKDRFWEILDGSHQDTKRIVCVETPSQENTIHLSLTDGNRTQLWMASDVTSFFKKNI